MCDTSLQTLINKLESATKNALDWFRSNGMKLNSNKCKVLVCGHKFESAQVIETHMVKLLGIQIDSELTICGWIAKLENWMGNQENINN